MPKSMNKSPSSEGSASSHTPCSGEGTPRAGNVGDLGEEPRFSNHAGAHDVKQSQINGSQSGESKEEATTDYEDEPGPKEVSRRLVEYFVVVSSVPKMRKRKNGSPKPREGKSSQRKPATPERTERLDARRAHLESNAPSSPMKFIEDIGTAVFGEPSPAEKKSISNLQETDRMLEESVFGSEAEVPKEKGTAASAAQTAQQTAQSLKSSLLKSVNQQKKKIQAQANTAKGSNAGLQNLEKKLEGLNLDNTLAKFRSMKLLGEAPRPQRRTPMASSFKGERGAQQRSQKGNSQEEGGGDDDSSSSDSSASLDDEVLKERKMSLDSVDGSAVRPSLSLTSARKTPAVPLSPPPPAPALPDGNMSRGASNNIRLAPLPDRNSAPKGASENIRIGLDQDGGSGSRDYNDDIDDCILEPLITAQYPPVDHPDQPLNPMIPQFCHPQGTDNIVPLHEYKMPTVHHFVLTDSAGGKLYGTCLTVYEEFTPPSEIEITSGEHDHDVDNSREEDQERGYVECSVTGTPTSGRTRRRSKSHKYYAPRVLCLLSTWPYLSAFRTYLTQLYRLATTTSLMTAPLERYILNICSEVPAPPPGSFEVKLSILGSDIRFWAPPADQPIPYVSLPYGVLFECLDIGNVLFAWYTLACERKMLLVSSQLSLLSVCAEILCSMIFPMRWSHLYIPCLPRFLTPMLDAPMPYLCGISRDVFPDAVHEISDETVVVDLDRNVITMGSHTPELPLLPHRRKLKLEAALEKNAGDVFWKARGLTTSQVEEARLSGNENRLAKMLGRADGVWDEKICVMDEAFNLAHAPDSMSLLYSGDGTGPSDGKQSRWDAVQEAFLRFYVSMLKDYQRYMPSMPTDKQSSWRGAGASIEGGRFLSKEFVHSQPLDVQPFLEELTGTQQFDDFVTRRMYNAGDAPDVKFFDQSIDAKRNRSKLKLKKKETPFLHSANAHRHLKQIEAIQPNSADIPARSRFDSRFDFKKGLYTYPTWPESFDGSLFGTPRPIPNIITAEFDRRSALAAMLRARRGVAAEGRLAGGNNPSPEATAFVLFFVTFTKVIGQEWTQLEKQHETRDGNLLDHYVDGSSMGSSVISDGPWQPRINPPWMEGESNFHSLHSNFRPEKKPDPPEDIVHDDGLSSGFCAPDCSDLCGDVGKAIDPSTFMGWGRNDDALALRGISNGEFAKSPSEEELENEIEKARAIAKAQIDLGFNTLNMIRMRKLSTEPITYKTLIEACGRCGIAHRAQMLMEMMTQDGIALDSEVYFAFIKAFSTADGDSMPIHSMTSATDATDTASEFSANKSTALSVTSSSHSFLDSSQGEGDRPKKPHAKHNNKFIDGLQSSIESNRRAFKTAKSKRMKRLFKQKLTKRSNLRVTRSIKTHLELGYCILEDLYPGLKIDADSDTCPKCSRVLSQDDVILGWKPCQVKDFSTACPSCKHRFVPKFSVSCKSEAFEGSQGMGTTLYCDYLSPWVLLQEIRSLITPSHLGKAAKVLGVKNTEVDFVGIDGIIDPSFRQGSGINATLWWNMIVTFMRFKIPCTFLLQGSYKDQQLIMPSPIELEDEDVA